MKKNSNIARLSLEEKLARIESLDLEPIMVKLMDAEEGKGWALDQCFSAEKWYKRFLALNLRYPGRNIIPNKEIDAFWHCHILDTQKYQEDCANVFGYFLHHFPYLGMRGEADAAILAHSFNDTLQLFHEEYGEGMEQLHQLFANDTTCTGSNCGNSHCNAVTKTTAAGCDSGCQSTCHLSCHSSCHAQPVALKKKSLIRPTLASVL